MEVLGSLVVGLGAGALYSVFGVLLSLMASLGRVINFSQIAVGVLGAFIALRLIPSSLPAALFVMVTVLLSAVLSCALGWIIVTWLGESSTTARSAVTVAILMGLMSLTFLIFGTKTQPNIPLLAGPLVTLGSATISKVGVAMLVLAIVIAAAATAVLRWTPIGVKLRATSDRQTAAELLGVNVRALQLGVWAVMGGLSGLVVALVGNAQAGTANAMIILLIPAAAAALVGAFSNLWLAIIGGLLVGGLQGVLTLYPEISLLRDWVPILVIVLFLLWNQRKEVWDVAR